MSQRFVLLAFCGVFLCPAAGTRDEEGSLAVLGGGEEAYFNDEGQSHDDAAALLEEKNTSRRAADSPACGLCLGGSVKVKSDAVFVEEPQAAPVPAGRQSEAAPVPAGRQSEAAPVPADKRPEVPPAASTHREVAPRPEPSDAFRAEAEALEAQNSKFVRVLKFGLPFAMSGWMLEHLYAVEVQRFLGEEVQGMSGKLTLLEFTYKGPVLDGKVPFNGRALHKAFKRCKIADGEPMITQVMSEKLGCSVSYVGFSRTDDAVHLLTEYVSSVDAFDLRFRGPFPGLGNARIQHFVMGQLIHILKVLQENRFVHRDLKAQNFIFRRDCIDILRDSSAGIEKWIAKKCAFTVIDYGLGCAEGSREQGPPVGCLAGGQHVGTPGFIPPEAHKGTPWTHKGDVYEMGAVAVEIFTDVFPPDLFANDLKQDGVPDREILTRVEQAKKDPKTLGQVTRRLRDRKIDSQVQSVILSMLDPNRDNRPDGASLWEQPWLVDIKPRVIELSDAILSTRAARAYLEA